MRMFAASVTPSEWPSGKYECAPHVNMPGAEVATRADVSGRLDDPKVSTVQVVVRLIQNAFFKAILPGLEHETEQAERARPL